jgi:predicted ATPase
MRPARESGKLKYNEKTRTNSVIVEIAQTMLRSTGPAATKTVFGMSLHRFHGRKQEVECLQRIFHANLKRGDENACISCKGEGPECSSTVVTEMTVPTTSTSSTVNDGRCICSSNLDDCSAYHGMPISSDCRLVLISGPDGSGKQALANEALNKYRALKGCCRRPFLQVSGQFRSYQGNVQEGSPYTTGRSREFEHSLPAFHDAMKELIDFLLQDGEMMQSVLMHLKLLFKDPKDTFILMQAFPFVKKLLWRDPAYRLFNDDTEGEYCRVFLRGTPTAAERLRSLCRAGSSFFQAVTRCIPLVFVLADLHYADTESLTLFEALLENSEENSAQLLSKGLLMVTTCVLNGDITISDAIKSFLWQDTGNTMESQMPVGIFGNSQMHHIHHISLSNLVWDEVHAWTMDCGGMIQLLTMDQKQEISNLVFHHTNGNPFHMQYLFQFLQSDNSLLSEPIHKKLVPRTVAELYTSILLRQDVLVLNLVRSAAALSRHSETDIVDCEILRVSMMKACVDEVLLVQESGLLDFFPSRGYVRFSRKVLQMAAYSTIPDPALLHLAIGRCLWKDAFALRDQGKTTDNEMKEMILSAMMHLGDHIDLLLNHDERMQMSKICYECGVSSSLYGDFSASAKLFEFAISALGPDLWRSDLYETCLVLHNAAAQTYFHVCDVDKTERTLDTIFRNAKSFNDKVPAYIILVYARAKGQMKEGFRIISFVLSELGEPIRQKPGIIEVFMDLLNMKRALLGKSNDALSNLPDASEDDQIIAHFLSFAMFFIFIVHNETSVLLSRRLICFSVKHGISGPAAVAFAQHSHTLCELGRFKEAYKFGQISLKLANRFEIWRPRIHMYVYGFTLLWFHPFRDTLEPLCRAQSDAVRYGDLQVYGAITAFVLPTLFLAGSPLKSLQDDARSFCQSFSEVGQTNPLLFSVPIWSAISDLTGNHETLSISSNIQDADAAYKYAMKEGVVAVLGYIYAYRTTFFYLVGNYQKSLEMAKKAFGTLQLVPCNVSVNMTFYRGLATSALAWTLESHERRRHISSCRKFSRKMRKCADQCPENFCNKHLLMEAEIAALNGKISLALTLYKRSVDKAKDEEFLHEEGIAYERWGMYQLHLGNTSGALISFVSARAAYEKWGAEIVVERLNQLIASIPPGEVRV